jgi:hypothetical protein
MDPLSSLTAPSLEQLDLSIASITKAPTHSHSSTPSMPATGTASPLSFSVPPHTTQAKIA